MPKGNFELIGWNRGEISPLALARTDVERVRLSAETMINWLPKTQGPMRLAPGWEYLGEVDGNSPCQFIEFIASTEDASLIEVSDGKVRLWIDDAVLTRGAVGTAISNGAFATSADWTDGSTSGGTLTFGASGLVLNAVNIGGRAKCTRQITVAAVDQDLEHGLAITIGRGPVTFRCGSTSGGDEYISETVLRTGGHRLAFTPTGDFYLQFESALDIDRIVTSISIEAAGIVSLTSPWTFDDLPLLQWSQSADVVFVACSGRKQRRIERRSAASWSLVEYDTSDGPFIGKTAEVKLTPAATHGNTTLASDQAFFKPTHVGALFRLFHEGQKPAFRLGADSTFTVPIRVSGINNTAGGYNDRDWTYTITGTWVGTLKVRRSFDGADFGFQDYPRDQSAGTTINITANAAYTNEDTDDNAIVWYQVGFQPGDYTSGVAEIAFNYDGGGDYGIVRVTGYTSPTSVSIEVLKPLWGVTATGDWSEGAWSDLRGYPTTTTIYEGRLWWFGGAQLWGSVSDDYESYDQDFDGDAGPIIRSIGEGPVDLVNFAIPLERLILGTAGTEFAIKSNSFDEPLTPSNLSIKPISTQGSKTLLRALQVDGRGIFVQRSGKRVYEVVFDPQSYNYRSNDLTLLHPNLATSGIRSIAIQRQPDTRIHLVLNDGTVAILTYEPSEEVICWSRIETQGLVEKVAVLPGDDEDKVYYQTRRVLGNGQERRYLEKWAQESETAATNDICRLGHAFAVYDDVATATITGLGHLEELDVVVWADGACLQDSDGEVKLFRVSSGQITLDAAVSKAMIGLPYEAHYKSTKLAYAGGMGTALTQLKRVNYLGLIMLDTHHKGLKYGPDFDNLDSLPQEYQGGPVADGTIFESYDTGAIEFPGLFDADARLCLYAQAPRPVILLGAVLGMQTNDKA